MIFLYIRVGTNAVRWPTITARTSRSATAHRTARRMRTPPQKQQLCKRNYDLCWEFYTKYLPRNIYIHTLKRLLSIVKVLMTIDLHSRSSNNRQWSTNFLLFLNHRSSAINLPAMCSFKCIFHQEDSGGPLVCHTIGENRWRLVGITSWGWKCEAKRKPAAFVKVTHFLQWILNIIDQWIFVDLHIFAFVGRKG